MKIILLTLMVLLPLSTFANEAVRAHGLFTFEGIEVAQTRDQELVPSLNTARFNILVQNGYGCVLRGGFFNCQKQLKNIQLPDSLRKEISALWVGKSFEFIRSSYDPSITNESDRILEWDIFDSVKFEGQVINEYHYYLSLGEPVTHKFVLNFPTGQRWMTVQSESKLASTIQKTIRVDQFKSRIFELNLIFNN